MSELDISKNLAYPKAIPNKPSNIIIAIVMEIKLPGSDEISYATVSSEYPYGIPEANTYHAINIYGIAKMVAKYNGYVLLDVSTVICNNETIWTTLVD